MKLKVRSQPEYPLSIAQAAALVGVVPDTIRYYERVGYVVPIRFGKRRTRLYLPEHIDAIRAYRTKRGKKASASR